LLQEKSPYLAKATQVDSPFDVVACFLAIGMAIILSEKRRLRIKMLKPCM